MKKKVAALILCLVLAFSLTACGGGGKATEAQTQASSGDDSLQKVLDAGVLHVITEGNWMPFIYYEADNPDALTGYCIEIAREVGKKIGVDVEFELTDSYDAVLAGLKTGRYDCVSEGLPIVAIAEDMRMSDIYMECWTVLVARGDNEEITKWEDIKGKTSVNALSGSLGKIAMEYGAEIVDGNIEGAMTMIQNGQADCTVNSQIAVAKYLEANPNANIKIVDRYMSGSLEDTLKTIQGGFTVMEGHDALLEALNKALQELKADGTMRELSVKFFGEDTVNSLEMFK